jgi:hypothetical protein
MSRFEMLVRNFARKCLRTLGYVSIREREREFILKNIVHDIPKVVLDVGCWGSIKGYREIVKLIAALGQKSLDRKEVAA